MALRSSRNGDWVKELPRRSNYDLRRSPTHPNASPSQVTVMEVAAVVLFSSVVLWFVEEATDDHF